MIAAFVEDFGGEDILAAPIDKGFNRLAWLFPYLVGATGAASVALRGLPLVAPRRRGRRAAPRTTPATIPSCARGWTMSSATSIEKVRLKPDAAVSDRDADQGFRPWHFFVLASLAAATVAVVMSRRSTPEHLILISLTIGAAGAAAAGLYRMLAPLADSRRVPPARSPVRAACAPTLEREKSADAAVDQGARVRSRDGQAVAEGLRRDGRPAARARADAHEAARRRRVGLSRADRARAERAARRDRSAEPAPRPAAQPDATRPATPDASGRTSEPAPPSGATA